MMKFYLTGVYAIVMEWLDKNCAEEMETIIKVIIDCVMGERNLHHLENAREIPIDQQK